MIMSRYKEIEKSAAVVRDCIGTGWERAERLPDVFKSMNITISTIRLCSFEFGDGIHLEVRWDHERERMLLWHTDREISFSKTYAVSDNVEDKAGTLANIIVGMCAPDDKLYAYLLGD